jgi:hypothetical protein
MTQYINKDALVAEIKWRIDGCYKMCAGNLDFLKKGYPEHYYSIETYKEILSFIDTLEVKEVDLKKELKEDWLFADKTEVDCFESMCLTEDMFVSLAKKYFQLGLKAQKGENV